MGGPGMGGAPGVPGAPGAPGAAPAGADASKLAAEALALKHKGDYEKAAAKYEEAIAADTRNVDAHWGLAWTMAAMGRDKNDAVKLTRAKEEFQRFLQLSKDSGKTAEAKAALGRLGGG
jgi:tetratricopeptide (TPR) repeat protein